MISTTPAFGHPFYIEGENLIPYTFYLRRCTHRLYNSLYPIPYTLYPIPYSLTP